MEALYFLAVGFQNGFVWEIVLRTVAHGLEAFEFFDPAAVLAFGLSLIAQN
jgi:3-methyladenine DNA glycosylase Tag